MLALFRLLVLFILVQLTYTEEATQYRDGWIPISNEKVFGALPKNFIKTPEEIRSVTSWRPIVQSVENIGHFEENSNIKPHVINSELTNEGYYDPIEIDDIQNQRRLMHKQKINKLEEFSASPEDKAVKERAVGRPRNAKKIADEKLNNNSIHDNELQIDSVKHDKNKIQGNDYNIVSDESNTYEVTESSETSEGIELINDNRSFKNKIFNYGPSFKTPAQENLTNKLFSILGNYNIRTNDDLTNYGISRKKYGLSSSNQGYVYPVPTRTASRHNSQNYFPIDPVLAVLLSNYGYYLPGLYGFPGNYVNIYGYLAANNIHNNKPFGSYKIYSDTDSSQ